MRGRGRMGEREGVIVDIYINLQYSIVLWTIIYNNMIISIPLPSAVGN